MKKKECPSCAMLVDDKSEECPTCNYHFPSSNRLLKIVAIILGVLFLYQIIF